MYSKLKTSMFALAAALLTIMGCTGKQVPYTTIEGFAQGGTFRLVYQPNATDSAKSGSTE